MKAYKSKFTEALTPESEMVNLDEIEQFKDSHLQLKILPIKLASGIVSSLREALPEFKYLPSIDYVDVMGKMLISDSNYFLIDFLQGITPRELEIFKKMVANTRFKKVIALVPSTMNRGIGKTND